MLVKPEAMDGRIGLGAGNFSRIFNFFERLSPDSPPSRPHASFSSQLVLERAVFQGSRGFKDAFFH